MRRRALLLWGGVLALLAAAAVWGLRAPRAPLASEAPLARGAPLASSGASASSAPLNVEPGKALFSGSVPLQARMVGHDMDLPPSAVRCANCHAHAEPPASSLPVASASASASAGPVEKLGPLLTRRTLLGSLPRRGGPPSRYDLGGFCRLLRVGIDPASVLIPSNMPRYRLTDQECRELWTYLTAS